MLKSIIGKKLGMAQIFDAKGNRVPVTVMKAGPCIVTGLRVVDREGYFAVQFGFGDEKKKNLNKSQSGFFKKNNLLPKKIIKEFRVNDLTGVTIGQEIKVDIFKLGDYVDVSAISKGKGYAGVIKRHNFSMQSVTHGQSDRTRARGSSGGQGPQKVLKGTKMSGHLGSRCATIQKLLIVGVDVEKDVLLIKGSVPAVRGGILFVSSTVKKVLTV
jgi:large subunit ribosomal protein L3